MWRNWFQISKKKKFGDVKSDLEFHMDLQPICNYWELPIITIINLNNLLVHILNDMQLLFYIKMSVTTVYTPLYSDYWPEKGRLFNVYTNINSVIILSKEIIYNIFTS